VYELIKVAFSYYQHFSLIFHQVTFEYNLFCEENNKNVREDKNNEEKRGKERNTY
jgi:hypothetical protein